MYFLGRILYRKGFVVNLLLTGFTVLSFAVKAQDVEERRLDKVQIRPGINYHLQINHFDFAPILDFKIIDRVHAGVGVNYLYYFRKEGYRNGESAIAANIYGRYFLLPKVFVHMEYLYGKGPYYYKLLNEVRKIGENSFYTGLGYRQPFSDSVHGFAFVLADLAHSEEAVYESKILFKIGVTF